MSIYLYFSFLFVFISVLRCLSLSLSISFTFSLSLYRFYLTFFLSLFTFCSCQYFFFSLSVLYSPCLFSTSSLLYLPVNLSCTVSLFSSLEHSRPLSKISLSALAINEATKLETAEFLSDHNCPISRSCSCLHFCNTCTTQKNLLRTKFYRI
jgi:hypothetical protein